MHKVGIFVASFLLWCLLAWPYSDAAGGWDMQSIATGLVVSAVVVVVFRKMWGIRTLRFLNPVRWFWFLCYLPVFAYACVKANLQVVYMVLHPAMPIKPGIVKVRTKLRSEAGITALGNSITLTPGTMTVDANEKGELYVHWIYVKAESEKEATEAIVSPFEGFLSRIIE